jgi:hypothetical protein
MGGVDHLAMAVPGSVAWRIALAVVLVVAILGSACLRPPRGVPATSDLRRLVLCAIGLYGVSALASLNRHPVLAALVASAGIAVASLTAWLSRGRASEDPTDGGFAPEDPTGPEDPTAPEPGGDGPAVDWTAFERAFRDYAQRETSARSDARDGSDASGDAPARRSAPSRYR